MSISSRADHFFQTDSSLDEINRRARKSSNTFGAPIKLPSKLLAVIPDPAHHAAVYVAESAATVKRVALDSRQITHTYRGPNAPLTCLCLSLDGTRLFAGCWDRTIWGWDVATCASISKYHGHTDFVNAVRFSRTPAGQDILISGGAEGDILLWNPNTGERHGVLKGQSHAIQDLAICPIAESLHLFASFSDPGIRHCTIPTLPHTTTTTTLSPPIPAHQTSIYKLHFDTSGDLWTASADKTAQHLLRAANWTPDTTLPHPDFVHDILLHERYGYIITACRDEEVRVWNLASGELHHTYSGHFEPVTGLCLLGDTVVSVSIDATIRQWSVHPRDLQSARAAAADPQAAAAAEEAAQQMKGFGDEALLTAEEEREIEELMERGS